MTSSNTLAEKIFNIEKDFDFESLELNLKTSNIFRILGITKAEIRHSNFIAWLLDPTESHNLREIFLRRFLLDIEVDVDELQYKKVEIRREWRNIDLLILIDNTVVCIENKVGSKEHSNQLKRYKGIIKENFETINKCFVYLTPFGDEPTDDEYTTYSYGQILENIDHIVKVYSRNLTNEVVQYLNDYSEILKIEIMKEHELNTLAVKLYNRHKEAFDFIIENKPDLTSEFKLKLEKKIGENGWVLGSKSNRITRFLTPKLSEILPKTGGWTLKESFLFEIVLDGKQLIFRTVIAPGDGSETHERIREILSHRLNEVKNSKTPYGKKWLVHFIEKNRFDIDKLQEKTDDEINEELAKQLNNFTPIVNSVEQSILENEDDLKAFN